MTGAASPSLPTAPVIWALIAEKPGDNAQIVAVANATGLPWVARRLVVVERWRLAKPTIAPDISHIDRAASEGLDPPWPDLIITSGRRPMNVALWIKAQSPATRLVLVGRPHGHFDACDLIVAAPQFRLPPRANVINVSLPLLFPSCERVTAEAEAWKAELDAMARPLTAVMVGGPALPFRLGAADATAMMQRIAAMLGHQGSRFFVTSRRTPDDVSEAIAAGLGKGDRLFRWEAGATRNPYFALLGTADQFVVTGDSASMMVEAARLGKSLAVYELPFDRQPRHWPLQAGRGIEAAARALMGESRADTLLRRFGLSRSRDLTALHRALYRAGRAVKFGQSFQTGVAAGTDSEIAEIATRIRALLAASR